MTSARTAWFVLLLWLVVLVVSVLLTAPPAFSKPYSLRLIHSVDLKVRAAKSCRRQLGRGGWPVRRTYIHHSIAWRQGALRRWSGRLARCRPEARRVGVPPSFRRVMMCVHPKESSNWFLDGHHDGGLQFDPGTWRSAGGTRFAAYAYQASPNEQIRAAWDLTHGSASLLRVHWQQTIGGCL